MKNIIKIFLFTFSIFLFVTQLGMTQYYGPDKGLDYEAGQVEIQAGLGLVSTFVSMNAKTKTPPVSIGINYRFKDFLSVGAYFGYSSTSYKGDLVGIIFPVSVPILLIQEIDQKGS